MRVLAVAATIALWLLAALGIASWAPFPAGERHCDDTGCWQEVVR
jgi:hypothetical protein